MGSIGILGLGNRLMMDDGIGIYLVEDLQRESYDSLIRYFIGETDIDYCLDVIEECKFLIVVDAVQNDRIPGDISFFELKDMPRMSRGYTAHNLHFFHMLQNMNVDGILIGIEPYQLGFQDSLSDHMSKIYPKIKEKLISEISILKENRHSWK